MGKKNKLGISTLVERVEQLVNDALKRIDTLQNQVNDLREQVMERAGFAEKSSEKPKTPTTPASKKTTKSSQTAKKSGNSGSTAKSTTQKKASTKKASTASKASGAKKDDLTRINGIGPATAKKMQAKGITTIQQLANPSADDQKKLEEFRKLKNFSSWQAEAKKLV